MNTIKDVLYNLSKDNKPDPVYCRGIFNGVISTIMHERRLLFEEAMVQVLPLLPEDFDPDCIPDVWKDSLVYVEFHERRLFEVGEDIDYSY